MLAALVVTCWAWCRFYYFMFYVIEHYVDGNFRFAGVVDFLKHFWNQRATERKTPGQNSES